MIEAITGFLTDVYLAIVLILLFSLTIFVHELGHFLAALRFGMVIDVFSLGFGPAIWKKKIKGTTYKICAIPLGGYVALPQLDPTAMEGIQGSDASGARHLPKIEPWKKIIVSLAGATGNVLLAILFAWIIYFSPDVTESRNIALVGPVEPESAAYAEGLRAGDQVIKVEDEKVATWTDFIMECMLKAEGTNGIDLTVKRENDSLNLKIPTTQRIGQSFIDGIMPAPFCVVDSVLPGTPAEKAGFKADDIILEMNGIPVASRRHMISLVTNRNPQTISMLVKRKGERKELEFTPSATNEEADRSTCVRVVSILPDSLADRLKLQPGDVIHEVNGTRVTKEKGLLAALKDCDGKACQVVIQRGGKTIKLDSRVNWSPRVESPETHTMIEVVFLGKPAAEAGIEPGDRIIAIDGTAVSNSEHLVSLITGRQDRVTSILLERNSQQLSVKVTPTYEPAYKKAMIGIAPRDFQMGIPVMEGAMLVEVNSSLPFLDGVSVVDVRAGVPQWMQYKRPWAQISGDFHMIIKTLRSLFAFGTDESKAAAKGLSGPIIIIKLLWDSILQGILMAVGFIRFLNVNLALLNLLPIPVLDGGHIIFALIEWLTRKKLNPKIVNSLVNVFTVLLLSLAVLIFYMDARKLHALKKERQKIEVEVSTLADGNTNSPAATVPTDQ